MVFMEEGSTSFRDNPIVFRFRVSVGEDDKVQIWLEDIAAKQQWQTASMGENDYVGRSNTIPNAQATDYAKDFVTCLLGKRGEPNVTYERALGEAGAYGTRTLSLALLVAFASRTARFLFSFTLFPVALDTLALLTARVHALEYEIKRYKKGDEAFITLRTLAPAGPKVALLWEVRDACEAGGFQLHDDGRIIELVRGGRYFVSLHLSMSKRCHYIVEINGKRDRGLADSCSDKHHQTLSFAVLVPADALLRIVNQSTHESRARSLLTIVAL